MFEFVVRIAPIFATLFSAAQLLTAHRADADIVVDTLPANNQANLAADVGQTFTTGTLTDTTLSRIAIEGPQSVTTESLGPFTLELYTDTDGDHSTWDPGTLVATSTAGTFVAGGATLTPFDFPTLPVLTDDTVYAFTFTDGEGTRVGTRMGLTDATAITDGTLFSAGDQVFGDAFDTAMQVITGEPLGTISLTVDRDSGNITLSNTTSQPLPDIIGYSLLSDAGGLSSADWNQQASGSQLANDDDDWTVLTGEPVELSETVLDTDGAGDGGDLAATNGTWDFGNVWTASPFEDVEMELLLDGGTILTSGPDFQLNYTGNDDQPLAMGDLAGATVDDAPDGDIDLVDWQKFKSAYGSDVTGLTTVEAYFAGDLTGDGLSNISDFNAFRSLYNEANGAGSFELAISSAPVPEPATWLLAVAGLSFLILKRETMFKFPQIRPHAFAAAAVAIGVASAAQAQVPVAVFSDDFQAYPLNDPADFSATGNWTHNGNGTAPNASRIFDTINYGGTRLWISSAANAAAGAGIDSRGITATEGLQSNTDYTFSAAIVTETFDAARTATGTYDLLVGQSFGTATSVIGGPQAFAARGDAGPGVEDSVDDTYDDQRTTMSFNSGAVNAGDQLFVSIAFDGTDDSNPFVGIDEVEISGNANIGARVNTTTGNVSLFGDPSFDFDVTSYALTSALGQLDPGNFTSLEGQGIGDPAMTPDDGIGFEVLGTPSSDEIAEGHLTTFTTFDGDTDLSLGNIFDTSTAEEDRDLSLTLTTATGEELTAVVEYVMSPAVDGDYNNDGIVDLADYTVWRDHLGAADESAINDNGDGGGVTMSDYAFWKERFGNTSAVGNLAAASNAVPEPSAAALALLGIAGAVCLARRKGPMAHGQHRHLASTLTLFVAWAAVGSAALATVTDDRLYLFGDPGSADAASGANVGEGNSLGFDFSGRTITADEFGPSGGGFADLEVFGPTYTSTSARTGAANTFAANFDGTDDHLFGDTNILGGGGLGFPGNDPAQNPAVEYSGIFTRGIQTWVRPTNSGSGARQDVVNDTYQFGLHITEDDTWGMTWGATAFGSTEANVFESDEPVAFNEWTHVMQHSFGAGGAALYVNGVIVATGGFNGAEFYHPHATSADLDMTLGADLDGSGNFFAGAIDDLSVYVAGDNSDVEGGADYGTFNAGTDNEYIAGLDLVPGDATGEGEVNGDDVTFLIDHWRDEQEIDGAVLGDLNSRMNQADFNFDGVTNLADAFILHDALENAGLGGLDFSLLTRTTNVPEPATGVLAAVGLVVLGRYGRRRR